MPKTIRDVKKTLVLFPVLLCLLAPAAAADDAWRQELLKERTQKDVEFKTSSTSPMAGGERLTLSGPERMFITVRDGAVAAGAQAGVGTVFAVFFKEGRWYWDEGDRWSHLPPGGTRHRAKRRSTATGKPVPRRSLFPGRLSREPTAWP